MHLFNPTGLLVDWLLLIIHTQHSHSRKIITKHAKNGCLQFANTTDKNKIIDGLPSLEKKQIFLDDHILYCKGTIQTRNL